MIIGNSVSGPSVAVDRLLSDVTEKRHETEVRLAFGATSYEALLAPLRAAVLAAMMPILNMLSIVGVVSIPGMMTGQLLGGSTPLVAAEYQMAILFLLAATTTISTYLSVVLAIKHAVMSPEQRLTPERIVTKTGSKVSIDVAIWQGAKDAGANFLKRLQHRCCILAYCAPLCGEATSRSPVGTARARYNPLPASAIELTDIHPSSAAPHTTNGVMRRDGGGTNGGRGDGELDHAEEAGFRASYEIRANSLLPTGTAAILQFEGMNIKSGELMLFGVNGITFSVHRGQRVTLEGSSGLGKTRLLRAMAQLDDFMSGTATLHVTASDVVGGGDNGASRINSVTLLGAANRAAEGVQAKNYAAQVYAQWRSRVMYIPQVT
jgi:ABC-type multidrug transport system fused ATPase/permease subunit